MKDKILKREMFAAPMSKEARNSGIMAGFDMEEMEDQMEGEDQTEMDLAEMPPMARTPQNPEILMNNLRGDVRSVDARYLELAQMVGEEAAMETPPEVLAMLQPQLAAQQGGIGALAQAQGMMPPGAEMAAPQQPGMAMPQGGIPMPQGMESAAPFSQGAEEAPPTPDGMPPVRAAVGAFITPATRAAQFLADKASTYGQAANTALGRMFMNPTMSQPYLENLRGPGGRYTAEQVVKGGELLYPTFTQGLSQGVARLADQYPRAAQMVTPALLASGLMAAPRGPGSTTQGTSAADQIPTGYTPYTGGITRNYDISNPDPSKWTMTATGGQPQPIPLAAPSTTDAQSRRMQAQAAATPEATQEPATATDELGDFISAQLSRKEKDWATKPATPAAVAAQKTKMERIKEAAGEYAPLFEEMLGSDKEAAKTNALLLLSEAGLKLASTRKPTFAMALGEALAGVPRGFAAIAAQERELGLKVKSAAMQQAISDVDSQDKYAQALKLQMLKGDYELLKEQAKKGGTITEDGGAGLRVVKTKDGGSFVGTGIDPNDPTVKSAVGSRFTLRDTDNPFVENRGAAPTSIETDKSERIKLTNTLRSLDNSLSTLDNLKGVYTNAYGPGAWFVDKVNNLIVPVDPTGAIKPNFDTADAATRISTGMNSILKNIASANDGGRVAVQEQEWARETAKGISNPVAFFADKELAAKQFGSMEAMLRNARQQVLTQLGYETNDYVMRTPSTGTQNDPFVIPADPGQQKAMFTFLGSTIGKVQDPRATVYLRMPNGRVDAFNPTQLRGLIQQ